MKFFCHSSLLFLVVFHLPTLIVGEGKCQEAREKCGEFELETFVSKLGQLEVIVSGTEIELSLQSLQNETEIFSGQLGLSLPPEFGEPSACLDAPICWQWGQAAKFYIDQTPDGACYEVEWRSDVLKSLQDCFDIAQDHFWFVGPEEYEQHFPIKQESERKTVPYLPGDMLQDKYLYFGGVTEPYFLSSEGVALWLVGKDENIGQPLFFSWNEMSSQKMCATSKNVPPYSVTSDDPVHLSYKICSQSDARQMHIYAAKNLMGLPEGVPDELMLTSPIWSSWAQYKTEINESVILDFAGQIKDYGFTSSQIEIDDDWESCYGEATFSQEKFPDAAGMVKKLKEDQFRVTLWIHPFINMECPSWMYAATPEQGYLIKDTKGKGDVGNMPGMTYWWQGLLAGYIDFTNDVGVNWWRNRLEKLQTEIGIDSFKFDAGEVNWMPSSVFLNKSYSRTLWPAIQTTKYVEGVAHFGGQIEVRVGFRSQRHPIFVRMLDKDSRWGYDNGLKTLIPTLLQISISGYPYVLPDMIGGNGYKSDDIPSDNGPPPKELYIRWLQANTFMPAMQLSYVPWVYDDEVVALAKKFIALHEKYAPTIISLANEATQSGAPINRPIWWIDPQDRVAMEIDSEFLLGDSILVAPVLEQGATSRNIYLPVGRWRDELEPDHFHDGPIWLENYPAPIDTLPYFTKLD